MLAEWANRGLNQWTIEQATETVTQGTASYSLNTNVIDVLDVVCQKNRKRNSNRYINRIRLK